MKDLRVIFMGTPEFAVASLRKLVENDVNLVGVITAPDKPKGRGKKLGTSPVKDYAESQGLSVLQPTNLKDPDFVGQLKKLKANLQVIVAFRMLPEVVWSMPEYGSFNLHASLLPDYRGAAPINWAIINGETKTGVTTFFLRHEIDTGNIIMQESEPVFPEDSAGTLYMRLMEKGSELVLKTMRAIENESYILTPQNETVNPKTAPKIFKSTCEIDWAGSSLEIHNFIRGLSPYPGAWTMLNNKTIKIFQSRISSETIDAGKWATDNKTFIRIGCGEGSIEVLELQLEGKKRLKAEEFLKGHNL